MGPARGISPVAATSFIASAEERGVVTFMEIAGSNTNGSHSLRQNQSPEGAVLFVLGVVISVALTHFLPDGYFRFWREAYVHTVAGSGALLGLDITAASDILTVNGFQMRVIDECTALNYLHILLVAMLLYPGKSPGYRAAGMAAAVPLVFAVNCIRLIVTGIAGAMSRNLFQLVHEYLWVAAFAFFIFALWKIWADGAFYKISFHWLTVSLVTCSAVFALLLALLPFYGQLLSVLASVVLKVFLLDSTAAVTWADGNFLATYGGRLRRMPVPIEYLNVSVLVGLVLPRHGLRLNPKTNLFLFALLAIILLNALFAGNLLYLMIIGQRSLALFLTLQQALLLALPFGLWWIIAPGEARGENTDRL